MALPAPARGARGPGRVSSGDPLRENLYKLFQRSFVRAEKLKPGAGLAVYRSCAAHLYALCGEGWAQATVFKESSGIRHFVKESRLPVDASDYVQRTLFANAWAPLWTMILLKLHREGFDACCNATGMQHLEAARAGNRGVILLHSHTVFTQIYWRWAEHVGLDAGMTLWQWTWEHGKRAQADPKQRALEGARELLTATRELRKGGIVNVLADGGRTGSSQIEFPFYGRSRAFQPTFAELALTAGAPLLTCDVTLSPDGRILIEIGPAFPDSGKDKQERVKSLVTSYCEHLARRWRDFPGNLPLKQMDRFLKMPVAAPG